MIKFLKNIASFIHSMYSADSAVSSKRVFGSIGFIWACIIITIHERQLTKELLVISAALLGLETLLQIFKKF
jgi:hypothetical protein